MRDHGSHLLYCLSYIDRVLQRGGAWGSVYTGLVNMQATPLAAAGSTGTPLTTWLDLEAEDERDLCVPELWPPFLWKEAVTGKDVTRSPHFTFLLGHVASVRPGRGRVPRPFWIPTFSSAYTSRSTFRNLLGLGAGHLG